MNSLQKAEASADVGAALYSKPPGEGGLDYETFRDLVGQVRKQMGEEGVSKLRDSVSASLVRQLNSEEGIKALRLVPKSTESVRKLSVLFGTEKAYQIQKQVRTVKKLQQLEQEAIGGSKTGMVAAAKASRMPKLDDAETMVKTTKYAKSPAIFLKRVVADKLVQIINKAKDTPYDEKQIADLVFSRGLTGARKLNDLKIILRGMEKTREGREAIAKWWQDHVEWYAGTVSKNIVGASMGPGYTGMMTEDKVYNYE
jgi:hypothetical protein